MRFGTLAGRLVLVRDGRALDVARASGGRFPADVPAALARFDELTAWATAGSSGGHSDGDSGSSSAGDPGGSSAADWATATPVTDAELGPPVPAPRQVFAVALNYRPHAAEAGFQPPAEPLIFTKFPSCITGPVAEVALPPGKPDWEIEVVAVIGTGGYRLPRAYAWDAVAGLTV
ncbi:MAG TPA: fumarylacetoacetate hydrolase family protein, partial [Actinoplanes sp.]